MEVTKFTKDHFQAYSQWFSDSYLNDQLGPIDQEWLEAVLEDGLHYAFILNEKLVVVIGLVLPDDTHPFYVITDISTHPDHRRIGFASIALDLLISQLNNENCAIWKAYVSTDNRPAITFFKKNKWLQNGTHNDMLEFQTNHIINKES